MRHHYPLLAFTVMLAATLGACTRHDTGSDLRTSESTADAGSAPATDAWLGQWNGPEGTFLRIDGGKGRYTVTVQDLDGPRTFQGTGVGAEIHFDRDGQQQSIRATDGEATGMKWLREKSNCLTIRSGEGYCRD